MEAFIELCIRRPVTVMVFLAALFLGGMFSLSVLPLRRLPEFPFPRVTVETLYPGLGAEDIRQVITIPVEDALSSVKGLERMRSISRDGASVTVLDFHWGADSGAASVLVREAIDAVYPSLPQGVVKPTVIPGDPSEEPQIIAAIRSPLGGAFARNLAEYEIKSLLRRIDGVGTVILSGGEREELEIKVDLPRALTRGLPPAALAEILASETANIPAGNAREGDRELVVISRGRPETEEELESMILPSQSGPFRIGDLGTLRRSPAKRESLFIAVSGGKSAEYAALEVYRRPGADPVKLSREVKKVLAEAEAAFSREAEIVLLYDDSVSILPGIRQLLVSAGLGTAAVMGVLFFTLGDFRCGLLAGLSLPAAMAASLTVLAAGGRSLNNMSLSGIALGIGLVSDTSVIILDLLHRAFGTGKKRPSSKELAAAAGSVAASSFGGTLTTAVVFVPVIFLPGPLGALFGDLSTALVVSIAAGWVYSQFALPSLFRIFYRVPKTAADPFRGFSGNRYGLFLERCLRRPLRLFGGAALICAAGLGFLLTRPMEFIGPGEAREIEVALNFAPGTSMETIAAGASPLGQALEALPEIERVFGKAGSEEEDRGKRADPDYRRETLVFRCILRPSVKAAAALKLAGPLLAAVPCEALARLPRDRTEKLLGLSSSVSLAVTGRNREELKSRFSPVEGRIRSGPHTAGIEVRPSGFRPELRIFPDREASAQAGISAAARSRALYAASEGITAGRLELEGKNLEIKVSALELPPLEKLPLAMGQGGPLFLGSAARLEYREAPAALARLDRSDVLYIGVSPLPGRERALSRFLSSLCMTDREGGLRRIDESAFARYRTSLILTFILVLILLYLTMGAEFESLTLPLVLLLAIPFSLAGAGPALFLLGAGLDSSSILALMVLFGLSVNNGMVLYELAAEKLEAENIKCGAGKPGPAGAARMVREAAKERFRAVLTTTMTTVFALIPLAVSPPGTGERSMAAAMLGGIIASTALTLFALPPVLIRFLDRKNRG
ncbi:MAG: efflux RND transporter permease subunit [Treponema sp.]|jgi:multidrug efflux pump subunit AcrB|nr:efflux RND transporter permease subunit [Treponema sp.]